MSQLQTITRTQRPCCLIRAPIVPRTVFTKRVAKRIAQTSQGRDLVVAASYKNPARLAIGSMVSNIYKVSAALQATGDEKSALWKALKKLDLNGVKAAISSGSDVNERNSDGDTPLHAVAREGHYKFPPQEIPAALVQAKADLEAKDSQGLTALEISLLKGWQNISELLLKSGASTSGVAAIKGRVTCPDCKAIIAEYKL